jgi:hypothetical protein
MKTTTTIIQDIFTAATKKYFVTVESADGDCKQVAVFADDELEAKYAAQRNGWKPVAVMLAMQAMSIGKGPKEFAVPGGGSQPVDGSKERGSVPVTSDALARQIPAVPDSADHTVPVAHSKSEYKRLTTLGAKVAPPSSATPASVGTTEASSDEASVAHGAADPAEKKPDTQPLDYCPVDKVCPSCGTKFWGFSCPRSACKE